MKRAASAWIVGIALLLAYEMYAVFNATPGDTLSEAVWKYGQDPMLAFAAGVLVGPQLVEHAAENRGVSSPILLLGTT